MIRKSMPSDVIRGWNRFSTRQTRKRVCAQIMLKQRDEVMMRFRFIAS